MNEGLGLTTRASQPEDEPFLRRLFASVLDTKFSGINLEPDMLEGLVDMQFRAKRSHYEAAYPDAENLIVLLEEQPVGSITVIHATEICLVDISLLPEHRNKGIGAHLIKSLQLERKPITLHVELDNPAIHLYERLGFEETASDAVHTAMRWQPG